MDAGTLQIILDILKQFGIMGVLGVALFVLIFRFGNKYVEKLAERLAEGKLKLHKGDSRKQRKDSIFKGNRLVGELMGKLNADRAAVFEYHNGGYNLTGLPFLHFSLCLQKNRLGVDELSKDFDNVLVSAVPEFINSLDKSVLYFVKDLEELQPIFPRMYRELKDDGMVEAIFCRLEGADDSIGFLMLAFKQECSLTQTKITKELIKKTQKLSVLLDGKR